MCPVLKVHPATGESLSKDLTVEQALALEEQRKQELEEYKQRVKEKRPRKKKEDTPIVAKKAVEDDGVKVKPTEAPNREVPVEELLPLLNPILKDIDHKLQLLTKGIKVNTDNKSLTSEIQLPKEFVYKPGVTRVKDGSDAFNLNPPSGITSLKFDKVSKDLYIDRVLLNPVEIKELLQYPDKAQELLENLIIHNMWKNLWETKRFDSRKKYIGTTVATIKRPGLDTYAGEHRGDLSFIEIRLFSDATEV